MQIKQKPYTKLNFPPFTAEQKKEIEVLKNLKDKDIDLSDIPECKGKGGFYYIQGKKMTS